MPFMLSLATQRRGEYIISILHVSAFISFFTFIYETFVILYDQCHLDGSRNFWHHLALYRVAGAVVLLVLFFFNIMIV